MLALLLVGCTGAPRPDTSATSDSGARLATLAIDPGDNSLIFEPFTEVSNGWGPVERNRSNGEQGASDGRTLTLNGRTYEQGFGTHAGGSMTFDLAGKCTVFTSDVGVDDEVGGNGSVIFQVFADGTKIYDSGVMTGASATKQIRESVAGKRELRLVVTDAGDGNAYDHADWAEPRLLGCSATPQNPTPDPVPTPPTTLRWTPSASAGVPRYEAQGAGVNGKLYVFGGFERDGSNGPFVTARSEAYDPATNTWTALPDQPEAITHAGTAVDGAVVYFAGGFLGDHPGPQTSHVWRYDTDARTWSRGPDLPGARGGGALVRVGRQLHFVGGTERNGHTYLRDSPEHWVLDLDGGTSWRAAAPLPNPRNHLGAVALNGLIYVIGGQHLGDEYGGNQDDVHVYDPATNTWTERAPLPSPIGHLSSSTVVLDGRILVFGGVTQGQRKVATVLEFDPAQNRWSALTPLPAARQSPVVDVVGDRLVVSGGDRKSVV